MNGRHEWNLKFKKLYNFEEHIGFHKGVMQTYCLCCEREFSQRANWEKHTKQHILGKDEKQIYKWTKCRRIGIDKGFTEKYNCIVSY
jgi:hypothetical protein